MSVSPESFRSSAQSEKEFQPLEKKCNHVCEAFLAKISDLPGAPFKVVEGHSQRPENVGVFTREDPILKQVMMLVNKKGEKE